VRPAGVEGVNRAPADRLDPRSKLAVQFGVALAAFGLPVAWLAPLTGLALLALAAARLPLAAALSRYRVVLAVLALGPVIGGVALGPPWIRPAGALASLRSVLRLVPVLLVSAAYVESTPVRATRAAVQRTIPGRPGQLLGAGIGLTVRLFPVVRADVARVRTALAARNGGVRSLRERARLTVSLSLGRAVARADRLALALRARCFAYNPTLPACSFSRWDYPVFVLGAGLSLAGILSLSGVV
jgi:biotin transport system permease protein